VRKEVCDQLISECEQTCQKPGGDLYEVMKKAPGVVEKWKRYAALFQQVWNNASSREQLTGFLLTVPAPNPAELETVLTLIRTVPYLLRNHLQGAAKSLPALPRRAPTGAESPSVHGDLYANRATIRTGSSVARCAEAYGKALQRKPANHTKSVATKSQVEIRFYIKDKRKVHSRNKNDFSLLPLNSNERSC